MATVANLGTDRMSMGLGTRSSRLCHFEEHLDQSLAHLKEQVLRAHDREIGAGSSKRHHKDESPGKGGPFFLSTLPPTPTMQPEAPSCAVEIPELEEILPRTRSASVVSDCGSDIDRPQARKTTASSLTQVLQENGLEELLEPPVGRIRSSETAGTVISDCAANSAIINWADLVTRALLDADVPTFHLHTRWQEQTTSVKPKEMRDTYDGPWLGLFNLSVRSSSLDTLLKTQQVSGLSNRRRRCRMHPNSNLRLAWILLTIFAWVWEFLTLPLELSQAQAAQDSEQSSRSLFSYIFMAIWTVDILLSFLTGVYVDGRLHMDLKTIAKEYAKTWLFLDASVVVVEWLAVFTEEIAASTVSIFRSFRFVRLMKLLRFKKLHAILSEILFERARVLSANVSILKTCLAYLGGLHVMACLLLFIRTSTAEGRVVFAEKGIHERDMAYAYLISVHWALDFFLWSEIDVADSPMDYIISAVMRIAGFVGTSIFLARIVFLVQQFVDARLSNLQDVCNNFLESHRISAELSIRMKKFVVSCHQQTWLESKLQEEQQLLAKMPEILQSDLYEESRGPNLCKSTFWNEFQDRFRACFRHVCVDAVKEVVAQRHDMIFTDGYHAHSMLCILSGSFFYTLARKHTLLGQLGQLLAPPHVRARKVKVESGKIICEIALWTNWIHTGSMQVLKSGTYLNLNVDTASDIIAAYPEAQRTAHAYGRMVVIQLHHCKNDCTDLTPLEIDFKSLRKVTVKFMTEGHCIFLTHFKKEAGTEAALMQEALTNKIQSDPQNVAHYLEHPVFLDTENLEDLAKLRDHILASRNLVVLLTPGVFERPWCLVEIVTAFKQNRNIVRQVIPTSPQEGCSAKRTCRSFP